LGSRTFTRSTVQPAVVRSTMPPYSQSPSQQPPASATQQRSSSYIQSLPPYPQSTTQQSASSYTSSLPPYPQSTTQQSYTRSLLPSATQQPSCSYTSISQSSTPINLESLLQQQTFYLFCTDRHRRTFLRNPRSSIGMKQSQTSKRGGKKKLPTWTHTFVCLSNTSQAEVPDGD
jgi:hypothetical protein